MVDKKKEFFKQRIDSKIIWTNWILRILILCLSFIVSYDAWVHKTPLYYIIFLFAGLLAGRLYSYTIHVKQAEKGRFILNNNIWNVVLTFLLVLIRFIIGKRIMETMEVIWVTDALYLFFIGVYWSKWRTILHQMEDIVYGKIKEYLNN